MARFRAVSGVYNFSLQSVRSLYRENRVQIPGLSLCH